MHWHSSTKVLVSSHGTAVHFCHHVIVWMCKWYIFFYWCPIAPHKKNAVWHNLSLEPEPFYSVSLCCLFGDVILVVQYVVNRINKCKWGRKNIFCFTGYAFIINYFWLSDWSINLISHQQWTALIYEWLNSSHQTPQKKRVIDQGSQVFVITYTLW